MAQPRTSLISQNSRYAGCEQHITTLPDGRSVRYLEPRICPAPSSMAATLQPVRTDDRLDLLAYRTLGDAQQAWRICDANGGMDPFLLLEEVAIVRIPTGRGAS